MGIEEPKSTQELEALVENTEPETSLQEPGEVLDLGNGVLTLFYPSFESQKSATYYCSYEVPRDNQPPKETALTLTFSAQGIKVAFPDLGKEYNILASQLLKNSYILEVLPVKKTVDFLMKNLRNNPWLLTRILTNGSK